MRSDKLVHKVLKATDSFSKCAMVRALSHDDNQYTKTTAIRDYVCDLAKSPRFSAVRANVPSTHQAYLGYAKTSMSEFTERKGRRGIRLNLLGHDILRYVAKQGLEVMVETETDFGLFEISFRDIDYFIRINDVIYNKKARTGDDIISYLGVNPDKDDDHIRHAVNLLDKLGFLKKGKLSNGNGYFPKLEITPTNRGIFVMKKFELEFINMVKGFVEHYERKRSFLL